MNEFLCSFISFLQIIIVIIVIMSNTMQMKMGRETTRSKSLVKLQPCSIAKQEPRLPRGTLHLAGMGFTSHVTEECMVKAREAQRRQL